jgi:molybdopterin molybdotransferase
LGPNRRMLLAGLPGNPISALVCARLFLVPLIAALQGDAAAGQLDIETAELGRDLPANDARQDHLRVQLSRSAAGSLIATPLADQDSSLLSAYAAANALLIRAPYAPPACAGSACRILRI